MGRRPKSRFIIGHADKRRRYYSAPDARAPLNNSFPGILGRPTNSPEISSVIDPLSSLAIFIGFTMLVYLLARERKM